MSKQSSELPDLGPERNRTGNHKRRSGRWEVWIIGWGWSDWKLRSYDKLSVAETVVKAWNRKYKFGTAVIKDKQCQQINQIK